MNKLPRLSTATHKCSFLSTVFVRVLALTFIVSGCATIDAVDTPELQKPAEAATPVEPATPGETAYIVNQVSICPRMNVSNEPPLDADSRRISRKLLQACVTGDTINMAPAPGACLSSAYGRRGSGEQSRLHRGFDYQSRPAGVVVAAAKGKVAYVGFRPQDFGNVVHLEHGNGVYSAYAHLANITEGLRAGDRVEPGTVLGVMGTSGKASRAIHLHFETREGTYNKPSDWWGLEPRDLFANPIACP